MDDHQNSPYPLENTVAPPQEQRYEPYSAPISHPGPVHSAPSDPNTSPTPIPSHEYSQNNFNKYGVGDPTDFSKGSSRKLSKAWRNRLLVLVAVICIILAILFEVYKADFEKWVSPLTNWLKKREAWSWAIPVVILIILSFPPLFGHEIVQLIVGLTYPLGVAIGIACAGSILGEAACFVVFKYGFTGYVDKKIRTKVKWAAISRVAQQAGFRGVLVIRYSIVPPHLANPLFACTGMSFWLYMSTVILSLPKSIVLVALGAPSSEQSKGVKVAKVLAIGFLVIVTIFASIWIRKQMAIATKEIEAERNLTGGDEELGMLGHNASTMNSGDTAYKGVATTDPEPHPYPQQEGSGV